MTSRFHPTRIYPKANQARIHGRDKAILPTRKILLKAAGINFLMLQLLFFALFAYIFGALYQQTSRTHDLDFLYVDYDGGPVGQAVRDAYGRLKADGFPTLRERAANQIRIEDLRDEVCSARYWAVLYTSPGASARLDSALSGLSASTYNRSDVLTFHWNEARYSTVVDSAIAANLQTLASAARVVWATNGTFAAVPSNNAAAVSVYADPWKLSNINIQPTTQGSRLIYNTLVIILILIQEFFYLGTVNGLYAQFKIYNKLYPHRIIAYRDGISLCYTFIGSLCTTGAIWAFRSGWNVNANQFALSWAILWLFAHLNFLAMDVFTVWLAPQYVPMALITWIVFNVTSILLPFELSNGFYRWGYAMPAHEVYLTLTDIWSRGCNPQLHYALPILFAWELLGLIFSALGIYRRCHYAVIAEEGQERAFKERVDAAMAFERRHDLERDETLEARKSMEPVPEMEGEVEMEERDAEKEREKIEREIRVEDTNLRREQTKASRACNFGPAFDLAYKETDDS